MRTVRADQISEMRSIVRKQKASNRPSTGTRPRTPVAGQKSGGLCRSALPADTRLCAAAQKSRFPSFADTRYHAAGRPASHRDQRGDVLRAENLRADQIWQSSRVVVGDRDCGCGQCVSRRSSRSRDGTSASRRPRSRTGRRTPLSAPRS